MTSQIVTNNYNAYITQHNKLSIYYTLFISISVNCSSKPLGIHTININT